MWDFRKTALKLFPVMFLAGGYQGGFLEEVMFVLDLRG